jgi:hypothetical protein
MKAGYSGTPLAKKLGIKAGYRMFIYNPPSHYMNLFNDLPDDIRIENNPDAANIDFIHLFLISFQELVTIPSKYKSLMKKDGMMWVSWPKGSSNISTDLNRELVREQMLILGLVDIKVVAIDQDWSGLKFVYRVKDR